MKQGVPSRHQPKIAQLKVKLMGEASSIDKKTLNVSFSPLDFRSLSAFSNGMFDTLLRGSHNDALIFHSNDNHL